MATTREIRRRIRGVTNISQVTRALEAVSAAKVRKAQQAVLASRPYSEKAYSVLMHLSENTAPGALLHPLLQARPEVRTIGVVLLTGDRGLAGPFNYNIVRRTLEYVRERGVPARLITVGRKGRDLMWHRGQRIVAEFSHLPSSPSIMDITPIARAAMDEFLSGNVDEVVLAYTDFVNTLTQKPSIRRLMPIILPQPPEGARGPRMELLYEPNPETILATLLPRLVEVQVYQAVLESLASEHSARMVAMRNATENAQELVQDLTLSLNKARQQGITSELLDIAGGAEALAKARRKGATSEDGRRLATTEIMEEQGAETYAREPKTMLEIP